ncbi:transposase, partial [Glaciecola sp. SC05]|uniref:transposase n=1 Tax=Glaciecola sp. SC05 TaxID=1987355 RepID=UPI00352800FF
SNRHLQAQSHTIYRAVYQQFVGHVRRPVVLIDWSDLDTHKGCFLLRASVAFNGRGIAIYQEVHGANTKEKRSTHRDFLTKLSDIINKDTTPIIVTDAGYKTTWLRQVIALGWDYVGRVRKPMMYADKAAQWQHISELYKQATTRPKGFSSSICRNQPLACNLVLYKSKNKGRHSLTQHNKPRQSKRSK